MSILTNPRHEAFAMEFAASNNASDSYAKAYGRKCDSTTKANAYRLLQNATICSRAMEIRQECAAELERREAETAAATKEKAFLTIEEKRRFYASITRTPIGEIDEKSPLCASVKRTSSEAGGSVEYRTLDKLKATQLDSELAGHIDAKGLTVNVGVAVAVMPEPRRQSLLAKKREALERRLAARN